MKEKVQQGEGNGLFFVDVMPEASQTPGPVLADRPGCHVSSGSLDHPAEPGIMSELPSPREGRGSNSEISTFGVGDGVLMWQSNGVSPAVLQHNYLFSPLVYPSPFHTTPVLQLFQTVQLTLSLEFTTPLISVAQLISNISVLSVQKQKCLPL